MSKSRETQIEKRRKVLSRLSDHRRWYAINNRTGPVATIRIYDEIGFFGVTAEDFVRDLDEISAPEIICAINCPGGDVFEGIAIYNALRTHPAKVTTRVDALAASAASVIVQAGDERVMLSSSQMMIHEAWGISLGTAGDMRDFAELLDKQSDMLAGIYASRADKDVGYFRGLMDVETWLSDKETVAEGLADSVIDPSVANRLAPAASAKRTLNDEISETMDVVSDTLESAERVAALRSEKGKPLSEVVTSGLDELGDGLDKLHQSVRSLLKDEPEAKEASHDQGGRPDDDEVLLSLKAQLEALSL